MLALLTLFAAADFEVVIYGGTSAAIIAAVQADEDGRSVVVVSPDEHLGGLSSGGLGWTDSGRKEAVGGLSRDFYRRVGAKYERDDAWRQQTPEEYAEHPRLAKRTLVTDDGARWIFEPHVAEEVFEDLIRERGVRVDRGKRLDREAGATMEGGRIVAIRTLDGTEYRGKVFIDATYEGDLLAAAGVSYTVGRESNETYGETLNGVQAGRLKHQFTGDVANVDPYVVRGDPASGLLPLINHADPLPPNGSADRRVQAYCFRMCLTDDPSNRAAFPKPEGYDPATYELVGRVADAGWDGWWNKFDPVPNRKTDTNNHGPVSTDYLGASDEYPEASYEDRERIIKEHRRYQQGLMWFLANDPRVPESVRGRMSRWGLAKDEFTDNGNWPHQIYVREARRMVGEAVVTENHLTGRVPTPDPAGMGSYNMDSHNTQRHVTPDGKVRNEGDVQVNPGGPYPIRYAALTPKRAECGNLLVPVCVSTSHIAYGSIRMEPVFMILGQSAAVAADIAIERGVAVQDVPYAELRGRLLELGQVLDLPKAAKRGRGLRADSLPGVVDDAPDLTGEWTRSTSVGAFVGDGYFASQDPAAAATFEVAADAAGTYEVVLWYTRHGNRDPAARVSFDGGERAVNQTKGDGLAILAKRTLAEGDTISVEVASSGTGYLVTDALQLRPVE